MPKFLAASRDGAWALKAAHDPQDRPLCSRQEESSGGAGEALRDRGSQAVGWDLGQAASCEGKGKQKGQGFLLR